MKTRINIRWALASALFALPWCCTSTSPLAGALTGKPLLTESEVTSIADSEARARGFNPLQFSPPQVHLHASHSSYWSIRYAHKSVSAEMHFTVFVIDRTRHADVSAMSYWSPWTMGGVKNIYDKLPESIRGFLESNAVPIELESADLNGDGIMDYILVSQKDGGATRTISILSGQRDGAFVQEASNSLVAMCNTCGGSQGDAFEGVVATYGSFTVFNSWGDAGVHSQQSFTFDYSKRDNSWELVEANDPEYGDHLLPPSTFGLIKYQDFDPGNYIGKGPK